MSQSPPLERLGAATTLIALLGFCSPAMSIDENSACDLGRFGGPFLVGGTRTRDGPPMLDDEFLWKFIYERSDSDRAYFTFGLDRSDGTVRGTLFTAQGTALHDYAAARWARCVGNTVVLKTSGFYVTGSCFHRTQWDTQAYVGADLSLVVARYQTDEYGRFCSKESTTSVEVTRYMPYLASGK
jgi:hypothetical protein